MRVLLVHKFHKLTGGAEVFYFEVARVLKERGHQVAFFTTRDQENVVTGDKVYDVDAPTYDSGSVVHRVTGATDIFYSRKKFVAMKNAISEFKPDLVHAFAIHIHLTPSILEAVNDAGIPVVMSCNDYKHICPNYKIFDGSRICEACKGGKFYNAILKKCCKGSLVFSVASAVEAYIHEHKKVYDRLVNRYLFASDFMLNKTKEFWADKSVEYGVLKNPFDAYRYKPVFTGDYALYFGRIVEEKGVDLIIEAAKRVSVPVKIIGSGPGFEQLQEEVEKHALTHVELLGAMWGEDLDRVLYGARFVIVPSLWHENFPYVIFQAFAAGKPVIGSLRGGIPELVGEKRGLLFDPDDIDELASVMERLWHDVDGCKHMGKVAREYVLREFSDDVFYTALMSNYRAVLQ